MTIQKTSALQSVLTRNQKQEHKHTITIDGKNRLLIVELRYDDQCGNGHNDFAITGTLYDTTYQGGDRSIDCCGCLHEIIAEYVPQYRDLIQWHLCSSDEPMHYVANTLYHVSDTDSSGLRKGEYGSCTLKVVTDDVATDSVTLYESGRIYSNKQNNPNLKRSNEKEQAELNAFVETLKVGYTIRTEPEEYSLSKGKERDLDAARSCAIAPDATLEQLQDEQWLINRLPLLMRDFKEAMEKLGFVY